MTYGRAGRVGQGVAGSADVTIIAAADGSAIGNPGPTGWAWYVDDDRWASGGWAHGTNNMGELMAVLDLLNATAHLDEELRVLCDSKYVINTVTQWMAGWKRRGWRKKDGQPVMNLELVQGLDAALQGRAVTFEWVKGHAGHELNEAADRLANAAARAYQKGRVPPAGPGFAGSDTGRAAAVDVQAGPTVVEPEPDLFSELEDESPAHLTPAEEVVAHERALLAARAGGDRGEVAALLHPQWQEVDGSGRPGNRAETLDAAGATGAVDVEVLDVVEVAPSVLNLLWRAVDADGAAVRSSLWVREGSAWRQVFTQATPET
jgi:ribonuclease HI